MEPRSGRIFFKIANTMSNTTQSRPQISWKAFQRRYLSREDGYKYEWLDGKVEKTKRALDKYQRYILRNLTTLFQQLQAKQLVDGLLIAESDLFFGNNHRRPDICWLSDEQITRSAHGRDEIPAFVMEVISTNDGINRVHAKMQDYRQAGVAVIWHIFPKLKEVHVYQGRQMTICRGADVCSAALALPAFQITVDELFRLPVLEGEGD